MSDTETADPDHVGHRDRLRTRFLTGGGDSLQDYEILELLLFTALPRRDVKPLAKALLRTFGSLWCVLNASPDALRRVFPKMTDGTIAALTIVGAAALRMTRQEIMNKPVLSTWQRLLDYCQGVMANEATEQFRLLFLDRKNTLIADEVQQRGTVDHTPVYPREVIKRARPWRVSDHPGPQPSERRPNTQPGRYRNDQGNRHRCQGDGLAGPRPSGDRQGQARQLQIAGDYLTNRKTAG